MSGNNGPTVAVLGGGVGGLSAAHELAERGFGVQLYEKKDRFGGRSRSFPGPNSSSGSDLPAEHGFRFFPGFYRHVPDTMSRIPYKSWSVEDNLVETTEFMQATTDRRWTLQTDAPSTLQEFKSSMSNQLGGPHVPSHEKLYFLSRLMQLLSSCDRRYRHQYERVSWWDYIDADKMSKSYQKILGYGISQLLVAVSPEDVSTRTMGRIYLQLLQGIYDEAMEADRVLNGPTNHVWIDPWTNYLEEMGVDLRSGTSVQTIDSDGDIVTEVNVDDGSSTYQVEADYFVNALPIEAMRELLTPDLERAAPSLGGVHDLETAWMNGIMFYLERDVPLTHGHGSYFDSPWALTTVSQRQFWDEYDISDHEGVDGILSVVISDWNRPGIVYDTPAKKCSPEQIKDEVVAQLAAHLNGDDETRFSEDLICDWFLDPAVQYDSQRGESRNSESLLINTVGSLQYRPEAATEAENLVVATDYVRTNTDLATMEAANEAARRAVNAILERSGSDASPCAIEDISVPPVLEGFRQLDAHLYQRGLSHPGTVAPTALRGFSKVESLL